MTLVSAQRPQDLVWHNKQLLEPLLLCYQSLLDCGMAVIANRNVDIKDAREIFRTEGSGTFGGRANAAELKGFRQPRANNSAVPPAG